MPTSTVWKNSSKTRERRTGNDDFNFGSRLAIGKTLDCAVAGFGPQSELVLLLALGIVRLQKRAAAAVRHRVWSLTFCGLLLLPALAVLLSELAIATAAFSAGCDGNRAGRGYPLGTCQKHQRLRIQERDVSSHYGSRRGKSSGNAARSCSADGRQPMGTSPFDFGAHAGTGRSSGGRGIERVASSPD